MADSFTLRACSLISTRPPLSPFRHASFSSWRRIINEFGLVRGLFTECRGSGILRSSRRSEPSQGRGPPCFLSREEFAHREQQAHKREYDEHDLVDVVFAGRQSAYEVCCPEHRVIP